MIPIQNRRLAPILALLLFASSAQLMAQESDPAPGPEVEVQEAPAQSTSLMDTLKQNEKSIQGLESRMRASEGRTRIILAGRLDRLRLEWLETTLAVATHLQSARESGSATERQLTDLNSLFSQIPAVVTAASRSAAERFQLADAEMPAADQAATNARFKNGWQDLVHMYELVQQAMDIAGQLELDSQEQILQLLTRLEEQAQNVSVLLEISMDEALAARARLEVMPEDAELMAGQRVAEDRVQLLSTMLQNMVTLLSQLDLDVSEYEQQIILATGQLGTQIFDLDVIGGLVTGWGQSVFGTIVEEGPGLFFKLLLLALIVYIARRLSLVAGGLLDKALMSSNFNLSQLLRAMVVSTVRNLILLLGILVGLSQLGISLGPVLAGLGIAGFIVGFALQDSLSNFASGMMILIYRPFDVGDVINAAGETGTVNHMSLVNTTVQTFDNQTVVIPNNMIWQGVIRNLTEQKVRRVDLLFGISYSDDIPKTERVLRDILDNCAMVMDEPEPLVRVHELGDSSVNFAVRPWVRTDDYWDAYWEITRTVKMRFDDEGIAIPFPQRDVHLIQT